MKKLIRKGQVAVIISPGYGAGWSTWESGGHELVFDRELALAVLGESDESPEQVVHRKWPEAFAGGVGDLVVTWLEKGTNFTVEEYDGYESIRTMASLEYTA